MSSNAEGAASEGRTHWERAEGMIAALDYLDSYPKINGTERLGGILLGFFGALDDVRMARLLRRSLSTSRNVLKMLVRVGLAEDAGDGWYLPKQGLGR